MNDHIVDVVLISLAVLTVFAGGTAFGVFFADRIWSRVLERTGQIRKEGAETTGAVPSRAPVNTEVSAQRAITEESVEQGAQDIVDRYKAAGMSITKKQALTEARRMLNASDPLGGIQS